MVVSLGSEDEHYWQNSLMHVHFTFQSFFFFPLNEINYYFHVPSAKDCCEWKRLCPYGTAQA
jgi:hypothetical protein